MDPTSRPIWSCGARTRSTDGTDRRPSVRNGRLAPRRRTVQHLRRACLVRINVAIRNWATPAGLAALARSPPYRFVSVDPELETPLRLSAASSPPVSAPEPQLRLFSCNGSSCVRIGEPVTRASGVSVRRWSVSFCLVTSNLLDLWLMAQPYCSHLPRQELPFSRIRALKNLMILSLSV